MKRYTEQELRAMYKAHPRSVDAVAAETFGWTNIMRPSCRASSMADYTGNPPGQRRESDRVRIPYFTTYIIDAMTLVEKMPNAGMYKRGKSWRFHQTIAGNMWIDDPSLPLAITIAAILAAQENDND
jgi:hypothetical protein